MKILVCVDQSEFSRAVIPAARKLASACQADLELVTVIPRRPPAGEPWSGREGMEAAAPDDEASGGARQLLEGIRAEFDSPVEVTVLEGHSPAAAITQYARRTRPDVIAMATHSRGTVGEAALGSTAREVTRSGVSPVLLLHPIGAARIRAADIPLGIYVFTSDGEPLGEVAEVTPERMRIRRPSGGELWLPTGVADAMTTGQLVLEIAAADVEPLALVSA